MGIKIVEIDQFRIIGLRQETLLRDTRDQMIIPKLQQLFNERLEEVKGILGFPITYGAGDAYGELSEWINNSEYEQAGTYGFEMYSKVHSLFERGLADFLLHFPIRAK
jgi:AraC family transcriptional regulator